MTTNSIYGVSAVSKAKGQRSLAPWMSRLFMFPPAVILTLISVRFIVDPVHAAASTGVTLTTPEAVTDFRVVGAVTLTLAITLVSAIFSNRRLRQGHLLVILVMGLALAVRVFGFINDGTTLAMGDQKAKTIGEVLFAALNSLGFAIQTFRMKRAEVRQ